jgi:hypothetical protein
LAGKRQMLRPTAAIQFEENWHSKMERLWPEESPEAHVGSKMGLG